MMRAPYRRVSQSCGTTDMLCYDVLCNAMQCNAGLRVRPKGVVVVVVVQWHVVVVVG